VGQLPFGSTQSGCWTRKAIVDLLLELNVRVDFVRRGNAWVKVRSVAQDGNRRYFSHPYTGANARNRPCASGQC
jgi:hypothetical protein